MATSRKLIGIKLRYYRLKMNLSLVQLAAELDKDKQYISDIELGKINITCDYLDSILPKLNVTATEFHSSPIPVLQEATAHNNSNHHS